MGNTAYKAKHREEGLCIFCSEASEPHSPYCKKHIQSRKESQRKYWFKKKQYYLENHICLTCKKPLNPEIDSSHVVCLNCREHIHLTNRRRSYATDN